MFLLELGIGNWELGVAMFQKTGYKVPTGIGRSQGKMKFVDIFIGILYCSGFEGCFLLSENVVFSNNARYKRAP